jgi:hypothetical protein
MLSHLIVHYFMILSFLLPTLSMQVLYASIFVRLDQAAGFTFTRIEYSSNFRNIRSIPI